MLYPSLPACYRTLEERWTAYQEQLQFLHEQADYLLNQLDHILSEQVQNLLQQPIPPHGFTLTPEEHLTFLDGWIGYLLRQHHANRVLLRQHLQEQQSALYEILKSDCQQPLSQIQVALHLRSALRPPSP